MLTLIVAAAFAVQAPRPPDEPPRIVVDATHDRIKDESRSTLTLGRVVTIEGRSPLKIDMSIYRVWRGLDRKPTAAGDQVIIQVETKADETYFDQDNDLAILAGEERFKAALLDHRTRFDRERVVRTEIVGQGYRNVEVDVPTTEIWTREVLTWAIPFGDLWRLTGRGVTRAEVAVGKKAWDLDTAQLDAIRDWLELMAVSSADAERIEKDREAARRMAAADAAARQDVYRGDVEAAVEKARRAMKAVPKKLYATAGEKAKWRTFSREIEAVIKKHSLTNEDVEGVLKDHPDFKDWYLHR